MHIECHSCPVRDRHCGDCMVTALLQMPVLRTGLDLIDPGAASEQSPNLTDRERAAVDVLVGAGLISRAEACKAQPVVTPLQELRSTG